MVHDYRHQRVHFHRPTIQKLESKKRVHATEDHRASGQKKQPRMVPVRKHRLFFRVSSSTPTTGSQKTVDNSAPGQLPAIQLDSLSYCNRGGIAQSLLLMIMILLRFLHTAFLPSLIILTRLLFF